LKKRITALLCLALAAMLPAGCAGARDLNELVIVMGIGIDKDEKTPGNITLTAQIVLPEKISSPGEGGSSSESASYYNMGSSAENTFEAVREYTHMISGKLYTAHAEVFVIGRKMAEQGIAPNLDFFIRAKETRPTAKIVIADTTASQVMDIMPKMNRLPATNISRLVDEQADNSQSRDAELLDFIKAMQSSTTAFIAPIVRVEKNEGEDKLAIRGMAVFRDDRMVGELSEDETRGVLWVTGDVKSAVINIRIGGGVASFEVLSAGSSISPSVEDGKVTIKISVSVSTEMAEQTCPENLQTQEKMKELQGLIGQAVCDEIAMAFQKSVQLKADVFGFGEAVHKRYNAQWSEMEPEWDAIYPQIMLDVRTKVTIVSAGAIEKPIWTDDK
jgi:spore germination protein KC